MGGKCISAKSKRILYNKNEGEVVITNQKQQPVKTNQENDPEKNPEFSKNMFFFNSFQ